MRSTSQYGLRALIAATSVGVAVLSVIVGPLGSVVASLILIALTPFVVLDPGSRLTALLLALHGVNWLLSNTVPDGRRDWALTFVVAFGLLVIHLSASLASSLPEAAPVPRASLVRWSRRALGVVAFSVPVWALLASQTVSRPGGDSVLTYAALAALALLGLAFWLSQVGSVGRSPNR